MNFRNIFLIIIDVLLTFRKNVILCYVKTVKNVSLFKLTF